MLKLDLHIHSQYSEDAIGSLEDIIKRLKKKGLHGMAITDHNTNKGALKSKQIKQKDFVVIPGMEISTKDGHIIALNVTENIKKHCSAEETVDIILEMGGVPIVPHLFRNMSGIKKENLLKFHNKLSAIEVFNSCSLPKTNVKTAKIAKQLGLGGTGGSDAHHPQYVGYAYTTVDTTDPSIDTILSEIQKKKTWGEGFTMPLEYRRDRMMKSIKQFFQRGFKRI